MSKDGLTVRPWFAWSPRDFYGDPAVAAMDREERWRYRDALDAAWLWNEPAIGTEAEWREACDYPEEEWPAHRRRVLRAMHVEPDGRWRQKRLRDEYENWLRRVEQSREAGKARQRQANDRSATAQRPLERPLERPLNTGSGRAIDIEAQESQRTSCLSSPPSATKKGAADAALGLVRSTADKMAARTPGPESLSRSRVWAAAKALPPGFAKVAMQLVGRLSKLGASEFETVCALHDYCQRGHEIHEPFAFYRPGTDQWQAMTLTWGARYSVEAAQADEGLTKAWLAGR